MGRPTTGLRRLWPASEDDVTSHLKWDRVGIRGVVAKRLASLGMALVAGMHLILFTTALPHPVWTAVNALGALGAVLAVVALARFEERWAIGLLAGASGLQAMARVVVLAQAQRFELATLVPVIMLFGFLVATIAAALFAARPSSRPEARASAIRAGLGMVALASFFNLLAAISSRPLEAMLAITLGTVGFALVAPNVEALPAHAAWRPAARPPKPDETAGAA